MRFGILPHDESTINDFSQLIPAELDDYNDCADSVPLEEPDEFEQRHNETGKALFQFAKFKFDTLHPFSRPDSLTRRGHTLIARRKVTVEQSQNGVIRRIDRSPRGEQRWKDAVKASNLIASLVPNREDVDWDVEQEDMTWAEELAYETLMEGF